MIGLTIVFIVMFAVALLPVGFYIWQKKQIAELAPGQRFVFSNEEANPFLDDKSVYTIVEIRNGWVRSRRGESLSIDRKASDFVYLMTKID